MKNEYKTIVCKKCRNIFTANKFYFGRICFNCESKIQNQKEKKLEYEAKLKFYSPENYY